MLALLLLGLPAPARGQAAMPAGLRLETAHALGGHHRTGSLVPIAVEAANDGEADLSLRLESDATGHATVRRLDLPAGSRKGFLFWVGPAGWERSFELRLADERGRILHVQDVTSVPVPATTPLVGVLGSGGLGLSRLRSSDALRLAHLEAATLPDRAAGLRPLDALVWSDPEPASLDPAQLAAVAAWTEEGGVLILAVNDIWLDASLGSLQGWTDLKPLGSAVRTELPSLGAAAGRPFDPLDEPLSLARLGSGVGEVWLQEPWGAIVTSERRGRGRVVMLGFDPSDGPLRRWGGIAPLWADLLGRAGLVLARDEDDGLSSVGSPGRGFDLVTAIQQNLDRVEGVEPPPFLWILVVLALYLLMIGPVDYFVLKKLNRLSWTWVTYPVIVLVFTLGTWAVAQSSKSGDPLLQAFVLRDLHPASESWEEEVHASLFAVEAGTYSLRLAEGDPLPVTAADPYARAGGWNLGPMGTPTSIQGSGEITARTPKWATLGGRFLRTMPAPGAEIRARLQVVPDVVGLPQLIGRIHPRLGADLRDARLLLEINGRLLTFDLSLLADDTPRSLEPVVGHTLTPGEIYQQQGDIPMALTAQTARRLLAEQFDRDDQQSRWSWYVDQLLADPYPHHDWSHFLHQGGGVLLARMEDPGPDLHAEGTESEILSHTTWVRVPIPPEAIESLGGDTSESP